MATGPRLATMRIVGIVLLLSVLQLPHGRSVSPVLDCQDSFVREGETLRCTCRSRENPSCTVAWPEESDVSSGPTLEKPDVGRKDNGSRFTCLMNCAGHESSAVHILQVAYGPSADSVRLEGPSEFLADEKRKLTLKCLVSDVNPRPFFTWSGVTCDNGDTDSTCTFAPQFWQDGKEVTCTAINPKSYVTASAVFTLDLIYPPPSGPVLSGYTPGQPLQPGRSAECTVHGGKPLVSSVDFRCSDSDHHDDDDDDDDSFADEPDETHDSSVTSPLTALSSAHVTHGGAQLTCACSAVWAPDPTAYTRREVGNISLPVPTVRPARQKAGHDTARAGVWGPIVGAVGGAVVLGIIVLVLIIVKRKRSKVKSDDEQEDRASLWWNINCQKSEQNGQEDDRIEDPDPGYASTDDLAKGPSPSSSSSPCTASDSLLKPKAPKPLPRKGSGHYAVVDEKGSVDRLPIASQARHLGVVLRDSSPHRKGLSVNPYDEVDLVDNYGATTPPPDSTAPRPDVRDEFVLEPHQTRGPLGDPYAQVRKIPKETRDSPGVDDDRADAEASDGSSQSTDYKQETEKGDSEEDGTYDTLRHAGHAPAPHFPANQIYSHLETPI